MRGQELNPMGFPSSLVAENVRGWGAEGMSREGGAVGSRGTMTKGQHQAKFARERMPAGGQAEMWSTKAEDMRLADTGQQQCLRAD